MRPFTKSSRLQRDLAQMQDEIDSLKILAAQPLLQNIRNGAAPQSLREAEFKVFSQFGDDGIIQYLIHSLESRQRASTKVKDGKLDHHTGAERFQTIAELEVYDLRQDKLARLSSLRVPAS
jgi:hypothetical protein